ncbi:MAG TPA: hypothetical protein VGG39_06155 [Polyangiaceae bacterium]|jgi:hypothetical protein
MSSTTTTSQPSKATVLAQLQALVSGLQKQLPNGTFTLVSTDFTTVTLVQALQGLISALTAVDTVQASVKAALVAYSTETTKMGPVVSALKRVIRAMYANAPDTLALFGLKPAKARAPRTAAQLATSAAKAKATRTARGTTSKKQKASVSGNVTGVTITPIVTPALVPADAVPNVAPVTAQPTAPQPAAAAPAAAPAIAAAQPAVATSNVPPPGHVGQ